MSIRGSVVLALALTTAPAPGQTPPGHAEAAGKRAADFIAAFNAGDAKAAAEFWTPDADYIDQAGNQHKGRAAIEALYRKVFADRPGAKLTITVNARKLVGADVALEDGLTEVSGADGGPGTVARFSAVLVRKDGQWYLESVRDSVARPPSNAVRFEGMDWLIGDWVGEAAGGVSGTASFAWAENQNFIVSTYATTHNGVPVAGGTQWFAWDPVAKQIKSWSFYSSGGFGQATWTLDNGKWVGKTTATTADGKTVEVTNVLTRVGPDRAAWQPTGTRVDGKPVPDGPAVALKRVPADRP